MKPVRKVALGLIAVAVVWFLCIVSVWVTIPLALVFCVMLALAMRRPRMLHARSSRG